MNGMSDVVPAAGGVTVACPKCGATAGAPCVYVPVREPTYAYSRSWERYRQTGQPMTRLHRERGEILRQDRLRMAQRAQARARRLQREADAIPVIPASPDILAAARALREFDVREHNKMRDWLAVNGSLLVNAGSPVGTQRSLSRQGQAAKEEAHD